MTVVAGSYWGGLRRDEFHRPLDDRQLDISAAMQGAIWSGWQQRRCHTVCYDCGVVGSHRSGFVAEVGTRRVRVVASLLAVFWGYVFFGLIDLLVPLLDPEFHDVLVLETGWGLMFVFLVAAPLVAAAVRPQVALAVGLQQVVLVAIAVAVAAVLSASPRHLIIAGGLVVTVLLIATGNARSLLVPRQLRWSWEPGALVVAAAVPWSIYASTSASAHRDGTPPIDVSWEFNHWPVQAALAVALVLVAALAATYQPGWVVPTWCVGVCAAWIGLISWIYPDLAASLGRPWGIAAFVWGLAFVVIMHVTAQLRTRRATTVVGDAGTAS